MVWTTTTALLELEALPGEGDIQQAIQQQIDSLVALVLLYDEPKPLVTHTPLEEVAWPTTITLTVEQMQQSTGGPHPHATTMMFSTPKEEPSWLSPVWYESPSPSSFSSPYPYQVPGVRRRGGHSSSYEFDEQDLAAYLDRFADDEVIGLSSSPMNCMVARALSLKYPGLPSLHVMSTHAQLSSSERLYFTTKVRTAIEIFDAVGYGKKTPEVKHPEVTKGEFMRAWIENTPYPPLTMQVVDEERSRATRSPFERYSY